MIFFRSDKVETATLRGHVAKGTVFDLRWVAVSSLAMWSSGLSWFWGTAFQVEILRIFWWFFEKSPKNIWLDLLPTLLIRRYAFIRTGRLFGWRWFSFKTLVSKRIIHHNQRCPRSTVCVWLLFLRRMGFDSLFMSFDLGLHVRLGLILMVWLDIWPVLELRGVAFRTQKAALPILMLLKVVKPLLLS
jgi:hypothetical protein